MKTQQSSSEARLFRMARQKKPGDGPGTVVRIDADLVAKARWLAARVPLELSAYVSQLLRPVIEREFNKAGRELFKDQKTKEGGD
jgi:hypothetical protein